jgi:hypothetical protein
MTHVLPLLAALAAFLIASVALWFNRSALATSLPLLGFVGGFYLLAFLLAIPSNMKAAGVQVTEWYRAWKKDGAA